MNTRQLIELYFKLNWDKDYCVFLIDYEINGNLLRAKWRNKWDDYKWIETDLLEYITFVFNTKLK